MSNKIYNKIKYLQYTRRAKLRSYSNLTIHHSRARAARHGDHTAIIMRVANWIASTCLTCAALCIWHAPLRAYAQSDFPLRPLRLVNPYTPGGSVDLVGRAVAAGVSQIWGQQVIVDNRPGAGTTIGTEIVVRADPDGYTMLCNSSAIAIMPAVYSNLRFDTVRDLYPIINVTASAPLLAVHPAVAAKSVKELVALAKAQPGKITAAVSGIGSTNHLTTELFKMLAQVNLLIVPYKGGGPAVGDLIGGQVDMFFNSAAQFLPLAKSGRVRVLAYGGARRPDYAPDIPTVAESGVPGFEASAWFAIYGPRALPQRLAQRWNDAVNQYLQSPQAVAYFQKSYMRRVGGDLATFAEYHKAETARWGKVIAASGIKPQ
jgi:tripartite-type tricarboxylate transporter receptor subunit TctC